LGNFLSSISQFALSKSNALIVSDKEQDSALYSQALDFESANWLIEDKKLPKEVLAQIRYRQQPQKALLSKINTNKYHLIFSRGQRAVMPGQSVAIYKKNKLLGGGIIRKRY
jgi:tRNA-specific 2-thiouridylase